MHVVRNIGGKTKTMGKKTEDKPKVCKIEELSAEEQRKLKKKLESDHRYIGKKDEENEEEYGPLFDAFVNENGMFYQFNEFVKKHKGELVVAFRGNGDNITIYHNNHVVWELSMTSKEYKVSFNYDHARYYCGREGKDSNADCLGPLEDLYKLGFKRSQKESPYKFKITEKVNESGSISRNAEIGVLHWKKKAGNPYSYGDIKKSYITIIDIMDSYFNIHRAEDRFRKKAEIINETKEACVYRPSYVEKRWQQRLFNHFKSVDGEKTTDLFAYDLEFSQAFPDTSIRGKIGVNEPDILAIRFENKVPKKLYFVEVKSTKTACTSDTSGALEHMEGMRRYCDELWFMEKRMEDVWEILKQYKKTGIYHQLADIDIDQHIGCLDPKKDVERVLLFTNNELPQSEMTEEERQKGSALDYYNNEIYKKRVNDGAKDNSCRIWITKSNYFDEEIIISDVTPVSDDSLDKSGH